MSTFENTISTRIEKLNELKDKFIDTVNIFYANPNDNNDGVIHLSPTTKRWGKSTENHKFYQAELKKEFKEFVEYFNLIKSSFPDSTKKKIELTENTINRWIEKVKNAPSSTNKSSKERFSKELNKYLEWLLILRSPNEIEEIIYVPDTNCLIRNPDIATYNWDNFKKLVLLIPPTVISELDSLKVNHRNENVRKKAESIIRRFKGFRKQGNIIEGVKINKNIFLKFEPREPKFDNSLSWLDSTNNDDRIINSVLNFQVMNIYSDVILLSTDLNIQNKAELAGIEYIDISEVLKSST